MHKELLAIVEHLRNLKGDSVAVPHISNGIDYVQNLVQNLHDSLPPAEVAEVEGLPKLAWRAPAATE